MGMSASQARLLFISSRMSDIELRSQQIANTKIRLADESEQVANNYTQALNKTMLKVNDPLNNTSTQLMYSDIMGQNGIMSGSYNLQTQDGKIVVSNDVAAAFEKSRGNVFKPDVSSYQNAYNDANRNLSNVNTFLSTNSLSVNSDGTLKFPTKTEYVTTTDSTTSTGGTGGASGTTNNAKVTTTDLVSSIGGAGSTSGVSGVSSSGTVNTVDGTSSAGGAGGVSASSGVSSSGTVGTTDSTSSTGGAGGSSGVKTLGTVSTVDSTNSAGATNSASGISGVKRAASTANIQSVNAVNNTDIVMDTSSLRTTDLLMQSDDIEKFKLTTDGGGTTVLPPKTGTTTIVDTTVIPQTIETMTIVNTTTTGGTGGTGGTSGSSGYYETTEVYSDAQKANLTAQYNNLVKLVKEAEATVNTAYTNLQAAQNQAASGVTASGDYSSDFYQNLFKQMEQNGYQAFDQKALNNPDFLQNQLTNGLWYLGQKNSEGKYTQTSLSSSTMISEVSDDRDLAKAEAEYNAATAKINKKEKKLDMQMKEMDTEHSALQTEYDSVKSLISDNVSKSFNLFS